MKTRDQIFLSTIGLAMIVVICSEGEEALSEYWWGVLIAYSFIILSYVLNRD